MKDIYNDSALDHWPARQRLRFLVALKRLCKSNNSIYKLKIISIRIAMRKSQPGSGIELRFLGFPGQGTDPYTA
jgi:hypothetical protein